MTQYEVSVEGNTPLLFHRFRGLEYYKKNEKMTDAEKLQDMLYFLDDDPKKNLAVPDEWIRHCIIGGFVVMAGPREKKSMQNEIAPLIQMPKTMKYIDLGTKKFEVDERSAPAPGGKARDLCIRPMLEEWKFNFVFNSHLDDWNDTEIEERVKKAGKIVGIGSNRKNGFGRFEVRS